MTQLGVELTSHDVEAMMHDAGVKADGRIFYEGTLSEKNVEMMRTFHIY